MRGGKCFRVRFVISSDESMVAGGDWCVMYDLHRLRLLRELKHRGTLAAVASALSYSPSTISSQLSQLEAEVGVPLLEPMGRRVRLTPAAEMLVGHIEVILDRLEQAEADIARSKTVLEGDLRIATFQTAAKTLVLPAVELLQREHPQLRVYVHQENERTPLRALVAHEFDLVIAEDYPGEPPSALTGLHTQLLLEDPLLLATPPDGEPPQLAALAHLPWVMEPEGNAARRWASAVCRQAGFEPHVRYQSTDLTFHVRLIEAGQAVGFLPKLAWGVHAPTVTLTELTPPNARRVLIATRTGSHHHPAVVAARVALDRISRSARDLTRS
ncbi:LysR family transcriptional regulator [Nonomuraea sp. 3N208]|uniref:LysR family transcriptional regulator n=1 Tax=Nonomuraea sp. 3N208 TaxID=3457421 RepID=UPI003FD454CB